MFERGIASGFFVVRRHSVNLTLAADEDKYFFRAGDARIEQVSVCKGAGGTPIIGIMTAGNSLPWLL